MQSRTTPPGRLMRLALLLVSVLAATGARAEWSVAGYIGGAHTQASSLRLRQPVLGTDLTFKQVEFSGESLQSPLYYGVRGGYFLQRHFGLEVEFIHLKVFAGTARATRAQGTLRGTVIAADIPINSVIERFSISHGLNLLLANGVIRHDFMRGPEEKLGRLLLAARVGAGVTIPHGESTIEDISQEQYQVGRAAWQLAGGMEFGIWRGLHLLGEYKFTRTNERVDVHAGTIETPLNSHHIIAGVSWHF